MKKILPDLIALILFVLLSFAYFFPADIENRIIFQQDTSAGVGAGQEAKLYHEQTGKTTRWTNSIFGGMPTYQMAPSYKSANTLNFIEKLYHLFLPNYVCLAFIMMLGFYILLRAFGVSPLMSALGGLIWAFSSYFFILIASGHLWKFYTLAYIPPTIAGMVLAYRKKYLLGGILTALFVALQIKSNHVQMSYYFLFVMLFMFGAYLEDAIKKHEIKDFLKSTGVLIAAALIGVSINLSNLYQTYKYSKETMRGKTELTQKVDPSNVTKSGLNRDYITQWSYGIDETATLLVPNAKGGASIPLAQNKKAMEKANPEYGQLYQQLTQYFGDQPGTSGPVYVGAFILFLFFLGCFIVKGPMKWALIIGTIFSIVLSWGKNFMGLTNVFIDYVPFYDKFRAVSSILVIAEFTIPLLAVFALKNIIENPKIINEHRRGVIFSFCVTAGLALLLAIFPEMMSSTFSPLQETQALQKAIPGDQFGAVMSNIADMRKAMVSADAWRSLLYILAGCLILILFIKKKLNATYTVAGIALLCLIDMWGVNKRYLNDDQFVPKSETEEKSFTKTPTDELILKDQSLDYRVLNFAGDTFNENNTAYWHKSVGGYHAAKLRRYQEMIEHHISPEMQSLYSSVSKAGGDMTKVNGDSIPVLNMLNTKYFIFPISQNQTIPVANPYAYGNAWFVQNVQYVKNADEEIAFTGKGQPKTTAIVDSRFKSDLNNISACPADSTSKITLTAYEPNKLTYQATTSKPSVAVFSEIYYPDWSATIDGQPAKIARADYILRAMNIPAGKHQVVMTFDPKSLHITEGIAYTGIVILLLGIVAYIVVNTRKGRQDNAVTTDTH
jgi:hypothetical protein